MLIERTVKMVSHSAFVFGSYLFALYIAGWSVLAEIGCPPAETIAPCVCQDNPSTRLVCSNFVNAMDLEEVFNKAERYTFQEVHIRYMVALYLPSVMFEKTQITELYIENSRFIDLFEQPIATSTLQKLQLNNTIFQRGSFSRDLLKQATGLKTFIANGVNVFKKLDSTFSQIFPSSLRQIVLNRTETKIIKPDAFSGFPNLDKLQVSFSKLSALNRDMFPRPFNVRILNFDKNNISYIPSDLFTDMPELQFLSMKNNSISEIPEVAFGSRRHPLLSLTFDGNPLRCNCLLVWLINDKPEIIGGTCDTPRNLRGKHLQNLVAGDFNC